MTLWREWAPKVVLVAILCLVGLGIAHTGAPEAGSQAIPVVFP